MQCNINARGKAVRLILGLAMLVVGLAVLSVKYFATFDAQPADWLVYVGIGCVLIGVFGVFEGWAGWCVVRAMGLKTRV